MLERILRERGYLEPEVEPSLMQQISREAFGANTSFHTYSPARQDAAVEILESVGNIVASKCERKWNSRRWIDVWDELNMEQSALVQSGVALTSQAAMTSAFKNLFQMLEVNVATMDELKEVMKLNKQRQVVTSGGVSRRSILKASTAVKNSHPRSGI